MMDAVTHRDRKRAPGAGGRRWEPVSDGGRKSVRKTNKFGDGRSGRPPNVNVLNVTELRSEMVQAVNVVVFLA